jgi:FkbM family methyltransferase
MVKRFIKSAIRRLGYQLVPIEPPTMKRGFNSEYLRRLCQPKTVFDVGVGFGTLPLYEAFPTAQFILVEPLQEYAPAIENISRQYRCRTYFKAAGMSEGQMTITVEPGDLQRSSLKDRTPLSAAKGATTERTIEVTTLDAIYREIQNVEPPILIKIDTEGFELEVLKGAANLLQHADTVIAEVSVAERFIGSHTFEDMIFFMHERGFKILDFLDSLYCDGEVTPRFVDVAFKRSAMTPT